MLSIISGAFAIVFGGSLIRLLTGKQVFFLKILCIIADRLYFTTLKGPQKLSLGGIIHKLQIQRTRKACLDRYPNILQEIREKENQGLLALIRDHYVDVHFLMGEDVKHDEEKDSLRHHQAAAQFSIPTLSNLPFDLLPNNPVRSI